MIKSWKKISGNRFSVSLKAGFACKTGFFLYYKRASIGSRSYGIRLLHNNV